MRQRMVFPLPVGVPVGLRQSHHHLDKVALMNVAPFKPGDNLNKWMESIWTCILLHQGGAALQHWVHEVNYLDNSLQPPPSVLHTAVHKFTP